MKRFLTALVIILALGTIGTGCHQPRVLVSDQLAATIIDQLGSRQPNEAFLSSTTQNLKDEGFEAVDIYHDADVGLSLFIDLPEKNYKIIVLRDHSGLIKVDNKLYGGTWLFTNEPCNQIWKYTDERLTRKIAKATITEDQPAVYAIGPTFVIDSMQGQFNNTIVIAMGCHSLSYDDMAQAFITKGASIYIGWTDLVNLNYSDEVTMDLIANLCQKGMTVKSAIESAVTEATSVKYGNEQMVFYPQDKGDKTFQELIK